MRTSYGVVWHEGSDPAVTGKLELLARTLHLDGRSESGPVGRDIDYATLDGVRIGRAPADRIDGRATVILDRHHGPPITISTVAQPSLLNEIAERLTALQLGAARRTVVIVPLKAESVETVRALLDDGPPFDPAEIPGLDRHEVFLAVTEAVFLFEARVGAEALDGLLAEPELWQAAAAWRDHLAGPPRIADNLYAWTRPDDTLDRALVPPGFRNGSARS